MTHTTKTFIVFLCLTACTGAAHHKGSDPYQPVYDLFKDTPVEHIDLKESHFKTLKPDSYEILHFDSSGIKHTGMNWATIVDHKLYAVSRDMKAIKRFDLRNGMGQEYTFLGRGPGEYQGILQLVGSESDSSIIIRNSSSPKIIQYTDSLTLMKDYILKDYEAAFESIAYNNPYLIYPLSKNENYLYKLINLKDKGDPGVLFQKRIIPLGKRPRAYNNEIAGLANDGAVFVLGKNMPLLFLYSGSGEANLKKPVKIVRFHHKELDVIGKKTAFGSDFGGDVLENPPPIPITPGKNVVIGFTPLFQNMAIAGTYILINQAAGGRLLVLKREGNDVQYVGSYQLVDEKDKPLGFATITFSDPWVILGNFLHNYVIRLNISELN